MRSHAARKIIKGLASTVPLMLSLSAIPALAVLPAAAAKGSDAAGGGPAVSGPVTATTEPDYRATRAGSGGLFGSASADSSSANLPILARRDADSDGASRDAGKNKSDDDSSKSAKSDAASKKADELEDYSYLAGPLGRPAKTHKSHGQGTRGKKHDDDFLADLLGENKGGHKFGRRGGGGSAFSGRHSGGRPAQLNTRQSSRRSAGHAAGGARSAGARRY